MFGEKEKEAEEPKPPPAPKFITADVIPVDTKDIRIVLQQLDKVNKYREHIKKTLYEIEMLRLSTHNKAEKLNEELQEKVDKLKKLYRLDESLDYSLEWEDIEKKPLEAKFIKNKGDK